MKIKLYDIAHSRAGDKGNTLTLSLIPYKPEDYSLLCAQVTAETVKLHLKDIVLGDIVRYELPNLPALQFVCQQSVDRRCDNITHDGYTREKFKLCAVGNVDR